jgi:hypothetical protein
MPDFEGHETITLHPGDVAVPVRWAFSAASTVTANDGSIPYGTLISAASVEILNDVGSTSSSVLVAGSVSVEGGLVVAARLNHPTTTAFTGTKTYIAVSVVGYCGPYREIKTQIF